MEMPERKLFEDLDDFHLDCAHIAQNVRLLTETVGGRQAYFVADPEPDNWLSRAVGYDAAAAIGSRLAPHKRGAELALPLGPAGSRAMTWPSIREIIDAGAT